MHEPTIDASRRELLRETEEATHLAATLLAFAQEDLAAVVREARRLQRAPAEALDLRPLLLAQGSALRLVELGCQRARQGLAAAAELTTPLSS